MPKYSNKSKFKINSSNYLLEFGGVESPDIFDGFLLGSDIGVEITEDPLINLNKKKNNYFREIY